MFDKEKYLVIFSLIMFPFISHASYEEGLSEYNNGNYGQAIEVWNSTLERNENDSRIYNALGHMFEYGLGTYSNINKSTSFYKKSCISENNAGCANLLRGIVTEKIIFTKKDTQETILRILHKNSDYSLFALSVAFYKGIGIDKNITEAYVWFMKEPKSEKGAFKPYIDKITSELNSEELKVGKEKLELLSGDNNADSTRKCNGWIDS